MKVYISGPMTGLPDYNYPAFHAAATALREAGHDVLNPAEVDALHNPTPGTHQSWQWYMRHAIRMVADADGVALLPGWQGSRGATVERYVAASLALPVLPLEEWTP